MNNARATALLGHASSLQQAPRNCKLAKLIAAEHIGLFSRRMNQENSFGRRKRNLVISRYCKKGSDFRSGTPGPRHANAKSAQIGHRRPRPPKSNLFSSIPPEENNWRREEEHSPAGAVGLSVSGGGGQELKDEQRQGTLWGSRRRATTQSEYDAV
jgi:hypothetical protein